MSGTSRSNVSASSASSSEVKKTSSARRRRFNWRLVKTSRKSGLTRRGMEVVDGLAAQAEMIHAVARPHEAVRAVAEGDQAEAVALPLGGQRQVERGVT